jgi:hypothetical protein
VLTLGYSARWRRLRGRAEGGGGANGGGAVVLGEQAQGCSISVRCGEVVVVPALNRRRRSVWGGEKIFSVESAGELGLLLEVRPDPCGDRRCDGSGRYGSTCAGELGRG